MFSDYDAKPISFCKKTLNNNSRDNLFDQDTQTELVEKELYDEFVQVIERENISTQTNIKEMIMRENVIIDEKKLENFMKKALSLVNEALNSRVDENFEIFDEDEQDEVYSTSLIMRLPCIQNNSEKNTKISDICWNSTGNILAITFYIDNHSGPCSHNGYIIFLKFINIIESKTFKEKTQIDTNSCIKSIDSHPKIPTLFVCSSFTGEIYIVNLSEPDNDQIKHISKIDSYYHKECVVIVKWVKFEDGNYYVLSLSEEGRLLLWNIDDKLTHPSIGFNLKFKIGKNVFPIYPTTLCENPFENFNYIVGTTDGNIYKCSFNKPCDDNLDYIFQQSSGMVWRKAVKQLMSNMNDKEVMDVKTYVEKFCKDKNIIDLNPEEFFRLKPDVNKLYKNALKSNFEKHISIVTAIDYNPFIKNLFLTSSFDGSLRVYHQNYFSSKFILSSHLNSDYYTTAIWSAFKPGLIISGTSNGKISFLKIFNRSIKTVYEINRKIENSSISYNINRIKCNSFYKNIMAVIYDDGILDIYKLSDDLYENKYDDIDRLNKIISNLLN